MKTESREATRREMRRQEVVQHLADHLLEHGLQHASLRPLAAASGTSDRMLLYYFADKNELLSTTLGCIAERMVHLLNGALPGVYAYHVLLPKVSQLLDSEPVRPYMRIWLELVALASHNEEPFRTIAGQLADGFLAWTAARLKVDREEQRASQAALLLATVDGMLLLSAIGRGSAVAAALQAAKPASGKPVRRGNHT